MEGLRVPQDARVNSPISSLVSAEEAEAAGAAGAAASPQPPGPPAERCWRPPPPLAPSQSLAAAAAGARHRGRRGPGPAPIPASRPHLHAFPRSRHGRLAAPRDAAWGRGRLGGERGATRVPRQDPSKASRGAGSAWVPPLGPPPGAPSPPFAALRWAWVGARRSPVVSLASRPHLPVSKRPTPGPGAPGPAPAPGVTLREGEGCECPDSVGWGSCREHGDGGGGPGVRGRRGCSAGPGTPGSTHPSPATASSSGGSGGGGGGCVGSAAPGAPGWEMLASAAASRTIPGSGGGCSGLQASRASPGPVPIPASRPHLHPFPRSRHGRLAAPRAAARGRGPPEARVGREGCRGDTGAWRAEVLAPARFRGLGPRPTPHRGALPSDRCPALGVGGGAASELWIPLTVRPLCACAVIASSEVRKRACVWRYCLWRVTQKWQLPKRGSSLLGCCGQAGLAYLRRR